MLEASAGLVPPSQGQLRGQWKRASFQLANVSNLLSIILQRPNRQTDRMETPPCRIVSFSEDSLADILTTHQRTHQRIIIAFLPALLPNVDSSPGPSEPRFLLLSRIHPAPSSYSAVPAGSPPSSLAACWACSGSASVRYLWCGLSAATLPYYSSTGRGTYSDGHDARPPPYYQRTHARTHRPNQSVCSHRGRVGRCTIQRCFCPSVSPGLF